MTFALHDAIAELATYNDDPAAGGITREVFTPTYERAVEFVAGLMRDAGLEVRRDAFGNLYGRLEGTDPSLPAVRTGSHVDTTLNAGRYDGVVGVLGAIEAVASLRDPAVCGARSRSSRSRARSRGSRAAASAAARSWASCRAPTSTGSSTATACRSRRRWPARASSPTRSTPPVGPGLGARVRRAAHRAGHRPRVLRATQIGVVTAIAAPHDLRVTLQGAADHAGATPMALRRDALAGAAEAMVELEKLAVGSPSGTTVGTVGVLRVRARGDQRRARRGRVRRRRPRQRRRSSPGGRRRASSPSSACWPRTARADRDRRRDRPRRAAARARRSSSRPRDAACASLGVSAAAT